MGIEGIDISKQEILANPGMLQVLDLELSRKCNIKCLYCYSDATFDKWDNEMTLDEIKSVISQAQDLGIKKVTVIGGGELMLYEYYWEVLQYIRDIGLSSITVTNGTVISPDIAKRLYDTHEDVVTKFHSFTPEIADYLAGNVKGYGKKMLRAIDNLMNAGYSTTADGPTLTVESIICKQNYHELPKMYQWCRKNNVEPYFEILTMQGRAKVNADDLNISDDETLKLFKLLQRYDRVVHNIDWPMTPPIIGHTCTRLLCSAYVTCQGNVQPCSGVSEIAGNIREQSLKSIIHKTVPFKKARNIPNEIQEPCLSCSQHTEHMCYGCRGSAYQVNGDIFAPDPTCPLKTPLTVKPNKLHQIGNMSA